MDPYKTFTLYYRHDNPESPLSMTGELLLDGVKHSVSETSTTMKDLICDWADRIIRTYKLSAYNVKREHLYAEGVTIDPSDFTGKVEHYCWSCGDGCCSDSGYRGRLDYKKKYFGEWSSWEDSRDREELIRKMLEKIYNNTGIQFKARDLNLTYVRSEDSDDPEDAENGGRREYEDY